MAKGLMDEKQQPLVQQELEKLFPSTRRGGRRRESRLHRIDADESSSVTERMISEIWESKTSKFAIFAV